MLPSQMRSTTLPLLVGGSRMYVHSQRTSLPRVLGLSCPVPGLKDREAIRGGK